MRQAPLKVRRAPPKERGRGSSHPLAPPPLKKKQTLQYRGAAVLRRGTFPAYEAARVNPPKGVSRRALDLLRDHPHKLLEPKHHEELSHVILPGGVLEPRINKSAKLTANRQEILDLVGGPDDHCYLSKVGGAFTSAYHSAGHSIHHPINLEHVRQIGHEASLVYRESTGGSLSHKDKRELRAAGWEGGPLPLKVPRDISRAAIGLGPGMVYHAIRTYHSPIGAQKQLGVALLQSMAESVRHPIRQYQRPGGSAELLSNVALPLFAGAGIARRAGAVAGAEGARATARAILRPPPVERAITYKGKTVHPTAVKSALGGYMQRVGDYVLQKQLENPDNMVA